jgi:predicted transcriptional regulator
MMYAMNKTIPLTLDFRSRLSALGHAGLQELSKTSTVPFTTLWKIKTGETTNPGIETVKLFAPHIDAAEKAAA